MDLIERYIHEVGRHLPRSQRTDVQAELRSLLQDMVEDQAQTKVEKADEDIVVGVLQEFGHPEKVAASYQSRPQYLIGPNLFPIFKLVLTIATVGFCAVMLASVVLSARRSDAFLMDVTRALVQAIPGIIEGLFSAFGSIVIVFVILERIIPEEEFAQDDPQTWDPRKLPAADHAQELDRADLIGGVVFSVIFLMLLNVFPQWFKLIVFSNDELVKAPLLSANFYDNLLAWVNLLLLVSLGVDLYKLRLGWRTQASRIMDIVVALLTVVVLTLLVTRGPVFALDPALANATSLSPERFAFLSHLLESGLLPIILILQLFSAGKQLYELWRVSNPKQPPSLAGKTG